MVGAHPAVTDAAEGQLRDEAVHRGMVDHNATRADLAQHLFTLGLRRTEQVGRQRLGTTVDQDDGLVQRRHAHHWQDRPENLLPHDGRVRVGVDDDRQLDGRAVSVHRPAEDDGATGAVEQRRQPFELTAVDDGKRGRGTGAEAADRLDELGDKAVAHLGFDQHVVRRDAGLPGVQQLRPGDAAGRDLQVGVAGDNRRTLATQFQGDRSEVPRGGRHHDLADFRTAGEEGVVKTLIEQQLGGLGLALDDGHRVGVKVLRDEPREQGRADRGVLGRFDDGAVARRDGADQRAERQVDRVVPRADDQHDAERFVLVPRPAGPRHERQAGAPAPHPGPEVSASVGRLGPDRGDVAQPGVHRRPAEVGPDRLGDVRLMLGDQPLDRPQLVDTPRQASRPAPGETLAQPGDDVRHLFGGGFAGTGRTVNGRPGRGTGWSGGAVGAGVVGARWQQRHYGSFESRGSADSVAAACCRDTLLRATITLFIVPVKYSFPDQRRILAEEFEATIPTAIEEIVRWTTL